MADVKPIPEDRPRVIPYLTVDGAAEALDFYVSALGAVERARIPGPGGKVMHAELAFGDGSVMVSDAFPEWGSNGPRAIGGTPVTIAIYVEDVDATIARAAEAGATVISQPENQFWGDRSGTIEDPFGHRWHIGTRVEDVSLEELGRRAAAMRERFEGS
jgi:PhnB protein